MYIINSLSKIESSNTMQQMVYDKKNACIAYLGGVSSNTWEDIWEINEEFLIQRAKKISKKDRLIKLFHKYLPTGSSILEGGCGMAQYVYSLDKYGYKVTGIDYAKKTVLLLNKKYPELDIRLGDVRNLKDIGDATYDAYYSGGVIEHFYYGYDEIKSEMVRILKKNGILIITFPCMTTKRFEIINNLPAKDNINKEDFYQFALNLDVTIQDFMESGFCLLHQKIRNGLKGYLEYKPKSRLVNYLYNYKGHSLIVRTIRYTISEFLCKLGYGHTVELVFKKL